MPTLGWSTPRNAVSQIYSPDGLLIFYVILFTNLNVIKIAGMHWLLQELPRPLGTAIWHVLEMPLSSAAVPIG